MTSKVRCYLIEYDMHSGESERCHKTAKFYCEECKKCLCKTHKLRDLCFGCISYIDEAYFLSLPPKK